MATLLEKALKIESEDLEGVIRLQTFNKGRKRNGGVYGFGEVIIRGGDALNFKIWDEGLIEFVDDIIRRMGLGVYLGVKGKGNIYKDNFSLIIEDIKVLDQSKFSIIDFYSVRYNAQELTNSVNTILLKRVTEKGRKVVSSILNGELSSRFVKEFAGKTMHDAEPVGLLHHTTKMLEITDLIMKQHNNFYQCQDNVDLIYTGVLLHDIGKTLELKDGVYTDISVATHRFLGAELLFSHKDEIVSLYDEMWYYNLISIITQHHGQYEERPRTIFSYITHLVDNFDTQLTILQGGIENSIDGQNLRVGEFGLRVVKKEGLQE